MEYFRDIDGQIQADIAYRLGRIILQYESLSLNPKQRFESTLYLAVLQNMLTNCIELLNSLSSRERKENFIFNGSIENENIFNLRPNQIIQNTFVEEMSCEKIIRHIRNALSHPTQLDINSELCSTGYNTIANERNVISEYCFVDSPDTKENRLKIYNQKEDALRLIQREKNIPKDIMIVNTKNGGYKFEIDGKDYARIIKIVLSTNELRNLTLGLCTYLAQPIQTNWNGLTIKLDIIAA